MGAMREMLACGGALPRLALAHPGALVTLPGVVWASYNTHTSGATIAPRAEGPARVAWPFCVFVASLKGLRGQGKRNW